MPRKKREKVEKLDLYSIWADVADKMLSERAKYYRKKWQEFIQRDWNSRFPKGAGNTKRSLNEPKT